MVSSQHRSLGLYALATLWALFFFRNNNVVNGAPATPKPTFKYRPTGQPSGQPSAQPSRQPSTQPTSAPTMIAGHFVQVANATDAPLVSGVDYSCGVPHTAQHSVRACTFRAALYYCYSLDRYRTAVSPTRCEIKMPTPPSPNAVFKLHAEQIVYSPSMLSKMVRIIIDGNGWTFRPTTKTISYLGARVSTTFPFLQTDASLSYYQEVKIGSTGARRRLLQEEEVQEEVLAEGGGGSGGEENSLLAYRSPLTGQGGLHGRRLLTYDPRVPLVNNTYALELRNLTFSGFGGVQLPDMAINDQYFEFSGSVLSIANIGTVVFRNVKFLDNFGVLGGAVVVVNATSVVMEDCLFGSNSAQLGAGFFAANARSVALTRVSFVNNTATTFQGGGCFIDGAVSVAIKGCTFAFNKAVPYRPPGHSKFYTLGGIGGGAAMNAVYNLVVANSTFTKNKAQNGGALAIGGYGLNVNPVAVHGKNYTRVRSHVRFNVFSGNNASAGGGALYWVASSAMLPPEALNTNTFTGNFAVYGPKWATEAVILQAVPRNLYITSYKAEVVDPNAANLKTSIPPILASAAEVKDFYYQTVATDSNSAATIAIDQSKLQLGCGTQLDFVTVIGNTDSTTAKGVVSYKGWAGQCIPGGTMNATYYVSTPALSAKYPEYEITTRFMAPPARAGFFPLTRQLRTDALVHFRPCAAGEYYNFFTNAKDSCVRCVNGYQFYDNKNNLITSCNTCPPKAFQCFSDQILLYGGTWRWQHFATTILACPLEGCLGGNSTGQASCRPGYHGPVCGICDPAWFNKGFECLPCSKQAFMNTNTIVVIVVMFLAITGSTTLEVRRWSRKNELPPIEYFKRFFKVDDKKEVAEDDETALDRKEKARIRAWMVRIKILVATYQVILNCPVIFNIKMGPLFQMLAAILQFLNFDILQIFPMQCVQPFHYIENMISGTLSPVAVVSLIFVAYMVQRIHIMAKERNRVKRREKMKKLLVRYFTIFVAFTYMILPGLSMKIFKTFECQDIDPNKESPDPNAPHIFLRNDYAVDCTKPYYKFGWTWALVMVGVYPFGVTLFNFLLVLANRKEIRARMDRMAMMRDLDDMCSATPEEMEEYIKNVMRKKNKGSDKVSNTAFVDGIQFLWASYRPEMWFWEVVETSRRLMCASVMSVVMSGTPSQCCFAVLVSIFYVKLYTSYKPYFESFDNVMAEFGHYQIFFTFFAVYIMRQRSLGEGVGVYYFLDVMVVCCNFLVAGAFLYTLAGEFMAYRRKLARVRMGLPPEEIVQTYRPRPRTIEEDMELILSCIRRSPKVLESMGLALEKKKDVVGGRRAGIEMSANSLAVLLKANAQRRDNVVGMTHAQLQQALLARAKNKESKKKDASKTVTAADLAALQEYQASSDESDDDSDDDSSSSGSGSGSRSGSGSSGSGSGSGSGSSSSSRSGSGSRASDDKSGSGPISASDSGSAGSGSGSGKKQGQLTRKSQAHKAGDKDGETRLASRVRVQRYSDDSDDDDSDSDSRSASRPSTATFKAPQYSDDSASDKSLTNVVPGKIKDVRRPAAAAKAASPPDHIKISVRPDFDV